ncbi:MAG: hypothetical protein ACSHXI_10750 [Hoeflea sp.]|uniref:hypothetical protein n=1 Tax=Hoeflea sp. TaxID=1940281 RepID=UPI003EF23E42
MLIAIDYRDLQNKYARTRPAHGSIPAAFLSMIGVDKHYAGQGHGGDLLVDALMRVAHATRQFGIAIVILDVLDDGNPELITRRKELYAAYGFQPLPSNPLRMYLSIAAAHKLLEEGEVS